MSREDELIKDIDACICDLDGNDYRLNATKHLYGVAFFARLLGHARGLDTELLYASALLHDLWSYEENEDNDHARKGAARAIEVLKATNNYSKIEISTINNAIIYHSAKDRVHSPFDEALKDADVLQRYLMEPEKKYPKAKSTRIKKTARELGVIVKVFKR